ncbi:putative disease resistance protein [Prunus yedoensis var. nudiflora]|uniref:Putative disease resistance protein n=1 Tax=Prunus yedoensis var. nudiflora TaxID=2094558 RepID=A0A314YK26_PRUYE|nr:putative disease resistance protein [Prunus yedoensis var. nudiflora]
MAEAVVSFVHESVRDFTIQEAKFLTGVSHQVEVAQTELQLMQGFLKDADARQGQDETVRIWVAKIRDAAYDLEDVIQTYGLCLGVVEIHLTWAISESTKMRPGRQGDAAGLLNRRVGQPLEQGLARCGRDLEV